MAFASIFVPNFMVQAVVRAEPALRDRALILVDAASPIRPVIALNAAASKAGIKLDMAKSQAQQFGEIEVRQRSEPQERIAHAALLDLAWSVSPRVEDTAVDTIVLDLAGLASLFGSEEAIAAQLAEGATRLGLTTQIATAANLDAAILASRAFAGTTIIAGGKEAAVIGKVPVGTLSPSAEILETLERWGVRTCAELAALPVLQLSERLGQEGVRLHELARARSPRAMVLARPETHFEEEMELEDAVAEIEPLAFLVGRLLDQLCARLEARSLAASALHVRFELEPSFENQCKPLHDDPHPKAAPEFHERTLRLPVPMRNPKLLLKLLILHWQTDAPSAPVLKINLTAEAALPRVSQGGLFAPICPDPEKVELTVARLANLVGGANIGSPELLDTHRPEGFTMRRFILHQDTNDTRRLHRRPPGGQGTAMAGKTAMEKGCKTALRVFRPAVPAKVELRQGRPARVAFTGVRGRVIAASGPWRGSGDWWKEDAWQSDEWDLEVQFEARSKSLERIANSGANGSARRGVYRVFYDPNRKEWFVRGAYD